MSKKKQTDDIQAFFKDDIWPIDFLQSTKFRHFIDKIPEAVFISNMKGKIVQHNREATELSGYSDNEMEEIDIEALLSPQIRKKHIKLREKYFEKPFSRLMGEGGLKLYIYNKEARTIPMEAALFSIQSDKGALAVNIIRDISAQVKEKQKIVNKALHDELTGLPNRYYLYEMAERMIAQAKRDKSMLMVLLIDLDKFKPVNDTLGHDIGDLLLIELSKRLNALKRQNEFFARLGGDEFVYLGFARKGDSHDALPQRIINASQIPFDLKDHKVSIGASIGMILDGALDEDIKTLLTKADKNLYKAKKKGGATVVIS